MLTNVIYHVELVEVSLSAAVTLASRVNRSNDTFPKKKNLLAHSDQRSKTFEGIKSLNIRQWLWLSR